MNVDASGNTNFPDQTLEIDPDSRTRSGFGSSIRVGDGGEWISISSGENGEGGVTAPGQLSELSEAISDSLAISSSPKTSLALSEMV